MAANPKENKNHSLNWETYKKIIRDGFIYAGIGWFFHEINLLVEYLISGYCGPTITAARNLNWKLDSEKTLEYFLMLSHEIEIRKDSEEMKKYFQIKDE